ncbi:MAG TPA: 3-oxoacyl-[acyl-carrier-protein] synthase III C-terminal domain-containing protein [Planctomycetota bacterium]
MSRLASINTALPAFSLSQGDARRLCEKIYARRRDLLGLLRIFDTCGVQTRRFSFPPEYYLEPRSFEARNDDFIRKAVELAAQAARGALERAGVRPERVDHLIVATTTGLATPSLDALLVPLLGLRSDVRRWPLFGLGCAGGVGAVGRAAELVDGRRETALVVSVEISGQVFSLEATTAVDVLGAALFGDGAAAAVVTGGEGLLRPSSLLFEGSAELMGWKFGNDGPRLVLSEKIGGLLRSRLREAADAALRGETPRFWALHPGGRRILEAYADVLGLSADDLAWSRNSLARVGNTSSASALLVLADLWPSAKPGDRILLAAPGPGFGLESVLIGC